MGNAHRQQMRIEQAKEAARAASQEILQGMSCTKQSVWAKPEFIYFPEEGRGELTRLAFAAGGIEFIDTRIEMSDVGKAKLFGQVPCLKHGEIMLSQSRATATYAAEIGIWAQGRLGSNQAEIAMNGAIEIMVLGAHADLQTEMIKCLMGDDDSKAKAKEDLPAKLKPTLDGLERMLSRKTSSGPFFFCESGPTLADLAVYNCIQSPFPGLRALGIDVTPYPQLCCVAVAVSKDPLVASYLLHSSMGTPELFYFNGAGRGQLTRLAFAAGDVKFTDTRIEQTDWKLMKEDPESVPAKCFGSMPCIKHGDLLLAQSEATATYAAQLGLWKNRLGDEPAAARATEMMVLGVHADLQAAMYKCLFGDDESKAKGKEDLPAKVKPILEGLERILSRKKSGGPFFFCESGPTLADLAVYDFIESKFPGLKALDFDIGAYPKLSAIAKAVHQDRYIQANFKP